jgi:Protein of unknown function (DUF3800)
VNSVPLVRRLRCTYNADRTLAPRELQFRSPRASAGFRVSGRRRQFYIAYMDEFGHVGPYISRSDTRHNTSPVFGLSGIVLPADRVRPFASYFYRLKCNLLGFEIKRSGKPAYQWEKKGAALYTTQNVLKYAELRHMTARLFNRISRDGGMVFYVGIEKTRTVDRHNSRRLYGAVLRESIKRLDRYCQARNSLFMMVLDEQEESFRASIVADASREMFGDARRNNMIEPPIQAESHLFQTLQCADWICGLVGRVACYTVAPNDYLDLDWTMKYFKQRLAGVAPISSIRRESPDVQSALRRRPEH